MNNSSGSAPAQLDPPRPPFSATTRIHKLFELQVERSPERIALVHGAAAFTYTQLNQLANRIAGHLLARDMGSEALVAVAMDRSPELIASILGVLKAGAAYLPIDPGHPRERLEMILADGKPAALLTKSNWPTKLPLHGSEGLICLDEVELNAQDSENPDSPGSPVDLAYVMYTSGSTGSPKGVMIEHRSVVRLVKGTDYADFGDHNVFLQFAPITFDASTFEIWGALLNGARLAIMPDGRSSLADLGNAIRDYGVTTLWLTAGLFHLMVDERIDDLRPLRQLLAGGDVLSVPHVQKVLRELDCDIINGYGPTENTTFTCTYKVPRNTPLGNSISIGKPIANTQVIILDEALNPVPNGEVGELWIGGVGLARGYLNSPEMTAERFIPNTFPDISSKYLYRSGDLARFCPDGNVEFLGRADRQVKIRGFRIELEEIEISLTREKGIREAVVVARQVLGTEKQLVAFVVPEPETETDVPLLRRSLEATLPEYMIPSLILPIEVLPLTSNGKVDRAALIKMVDQMAISRSPVGKAETLNEQRISGILEEILGIGTIGPNENFFDLGANSLQLARFHSQLQSTFDPQMKIVSVFQNPTVRTLAYLISDNRSREVTPRDLRQRGSQQRSAYIRRKEVWTRGN